MENLRGELLLSVTGVTVALRPGPVRINQEMLGRAQPAAVGRAVQRKLARFFKGSGFVDREPPPAFDYDEVLRLLPEMDNEARQVENVSGFETDALAMDYATALGTAIGYIKQTIPVETAPAMVGGKQITPPDHDVATFKRRYQVIDRPLLVLDDLAAGWLVDDQVEALAAVYPTVYAVIREHAALAMTKALGAKPSWSLSYDKDLQLQVLLQTNAIDSRLHADLLKAWEKQRADEAERAQAPKPRERKGVGDPSTQQERLEAK